MQSAVAAQQLFVAALARGAKRGFALAPGSLFAMQLAPRRRLLSACEKASVLQAASPPAGVWAYACALTALRLAAAIIRAGSVCHRARNDPARISHLGVKEAKTAPNDEARPRIGGYGCGLRRAGP